jgi:hypothetical protein
MGAQQQDRLAVSRKLPSTSTSTDNEESIRGLNLGGGQANDRSND